MLHLELFRVKVYAQQQASLFEGEINPQLTLLNTLRAKPDAELRSGYRWHVGNVSELDMYGLYFALGRTTKSTIALFDEVSGDFVEQEFETAPYTHVLCDTSLEVCAIARKARLAPTTVGIARQFEKLLNSTVTESTGYRFEVSVISDPEEFIAQLRSAHAVTRFALTFTLPNPFDVDQDFQAPMERLLRDTGGSRGKTALTGTDLDAEVLEELARSAAATGNEAEATIRRTPRSKPVRRKLAGDVATVSEKEITSDADRASLLQEIRGLYARIRRGRDK
jgi:hypothetical protein